MTRDKPRGSLSGVLLQFVGAAAGLTVLITLLGGLASWARFDTLDLAQNAAIASVSQTTQLIAGVTALALPVGVGLFAAGLSLLVRRYVRAVRWRWVLAYVVAVLVVAALTAGVAALIGVFDPLYLAVLVASAGLLVFVTLTRLSTPTVGYAVFFSIVAFGMVVATTHIVRAPTHLERAEVIFSDGHPPLFGFWIAATSDTVYIAPQLGGRRGPCEVEGYILGFPRDHIARIRLEARVNVYPRDTTKHPGRCPFRGIRPAQPA